MDQRPSGARPPSLPFPFIRFERAKTLPGTTPLPTKPSRCLSCGADYCCCKTMKNHQTFLERQLSTPMIDMINMDYASAKTRSSRIQGDLTVTSQSASSSWKRPPPPIMPVKPLFRPSTPPPPRPSTNASDTKLTPHQIEARKKLAEIVEKKRLQNEHPPPPGIPSPTPTSSEDGEKVIRSLGPGFMEWIGKITAPLDSSGLPNFPSQGDNQVPTPRPPPKFTYGSKPATKVNPTFPPPPPPTNARGNSGKLSAHQIEARKKLAEIVEKKRLQNQPQPTSLPPAGPRTSSKTSPEDPATLKLVDKMARQGGLGAQNSSLGDIIVPTHRAPPKFTYGSKPAIQTQTNPLPLAPQRAAVFRSNEQKEQFLGKSASTKKPSKPTKSKEKGDERTGGEGIYSCTMKPEAVDWYKNMASSGVVGDKNVLALVESLVPSIPPKSYVSNPITSRANPPSQLPPPRTATFGKDENNEHFLGRNSTVKRPSTPPGTKGTGGTITYSMDPRTLEFMEKWGDGLLSTLGLTCFGDKNNPVDRDNPPESIAFGFDEDDDNFSGNHSNDRANRPATPKGVDNGGGFFHYSVKPEDATNRTMKSENFGELSFNSWIDEAIVPSSPPRTHGTIYAFDENTSPSGLDLSWRRGGSGEGFANDYEKSPAWSPTPSNFDKEEKDDKAPPPIPLGEIHLRPWYNKKSGYIIHSCLICSQGFAEIVELRKHEYTRHRGRAAQGPLYCKPCDKAFAFTYQFNDHLEEHQYCRCCGAQLMQAVLNGFQRTAAQVMRGFMREDMGLDNLCENCKERERRVSALKRSASETWDFEEVEEGEDGESYSEEEDDEEEYDEEFDEEEEEFEEGELEDEDETDEEEEEMDEEDYVEEVDNKVYIQEMEDEEVLGEKKVENDIPENELGGVYVVEEVSDEEVEEEEDEYGEEVEEEEVEEEEGEEDDESMDDEEETEEEENE